MFRQTFVIGLALVWTACSIASAIGCQGLRGCGCRTCLAARTGGCGSGGCGVGGCRGGGCGAGGCDKRHDRYAARPYLHVDCRAPKRDPRIPGPRIISTLPRQPEMAGPSFFVPVPTYPVFGPRSEQADGIDPQLQPIMSDGVEQYEAEPLPIPADKSAVPEEEEDEMTDSASTDLKLTAPIQSAAESGWKPARNHQTDAAASRPCAKCSVTFKSTNPMRR